MMQADRTDWSWNQSTLLIVEDDPASRELLARRLQRDGLVVLSAADGPSALALLQQHQADGVLLDIGLPGMSGLEVLHAIRQTHGADLLPVLMVTAFDETERLEQALEIGANDYLNKPIAYAVVRARLRAQLERAHAARALHAARQREALVLSAGNDGVWDWDSASGQLLHSGNWFALLAWGQNAAPHTIDDWMRRIHPDDAAATQQAFSGFLATPDEHTFRLQYRMRGGDEHYRWIETRGAAIRDARGHCLRLAGTHTDISGLRYVNRVTNLPNFLRLTDLLDRFVQDHSATAGAQLGILVVQLWELERQLDIERRNTLGRSVETIAEALYGVLGEAVHIGSGELSSQIVILSRDPATNLAALQRMAQAIHQRLGVGVTTNSRTLRPVATIGLFCEAVAHSNARQSLGAAQLAARLAREQERRTFAFDAAVLATEERKKRILEALHDAIEQRQILPWWQPVLCHTGELAGFEALARWTTAEGQSVSPADFIPLAQSSGLLGELTALILDQSLAALARWRAQGLVAEHVYMAVNFPPAALLDARLPLDLSAATAAHELPASALCVEVTESDAASPGEEMERITGALRQQGFRLAIDDFGTGYSSLSTLNRLAFDTVKIDQSFVRGMLEQPRQHEMVRAIIGMARALGMKLVAEGVETSQQAHTLQQEGVDRMQGYLYARAMPEGAMQDWLRARSPCPPQPLAGIAT